MHTSSILSPPKNAPHTTASTQLPAQQNPSNPHAMDSPTKPLTEQEQKDEELINAAFQHLLDTYLASNHRRKVDIITKAFLFAKQAHKGVGSSNNIEGTGEQHPVCDLHIEKFRVWPSW